MSTDELFHRARIHYKCGRLSRALDLLERLLHSQELQLSAQHPDVADTLFAMAEIYYEQSNYPLAKPLYLRAVSIWHTHYPTDYLHWIAEANLMNKLQRSAKRLSEAPEEVVAPQSVMVTA